MDSLRVRKAEAPRVLCKLRGKIRNVKGWERDIGMDLLTWKLRVG